MNVNAVNSHVPVTQNNIGQQDTQPVQPEPKRYKESQQTTSHQGVVLSEKDDVKSTVEKLNEFNDPVRTNLKFVFHEDLHEYYVTVVNPLTDEVVRRSLLRKCWICMQQ